MKVELVRNGHAAPVVRLEMGIGEVGAAAVRMSKAGELLAGVDRVAEAVKAELLGRWFSEDQCEIAVDCTGPVPQEIVEKVCPAILAWAWRRGGQYDPAKGVKKARRWNRAPSAPPTGKAPAAGAVERTDRKCGNPECGNFIPKSNRHKGRPTRYCSRKCTNRAMYLRVKAKRARSAAGG